MIYYYSLFLLLTVSNFTKYTSVSKKNLKILNLIVFFITIIFTGFRYEIGADWNTYISLFNQFKDLGFPSIAIFQSSDPFYITLNIFSDRLNFSIIQVNFLISIIYFSAFYYLIEDQNFKMIALLSSFLFIVLILNMGYTRQALASAFIILFYHCFINKKIFLSILFFIFSVLSHKTSLVIYATLLITYIISNKNFFKINYITIVTFTIVTTFFLIFFIIYKVDIIRLFDVYIFSVFEKQIPMMSVEQQTASPGVILKIVYFFFFIGFFYFFRTKIIFKNYNEKIVIYSSILIIVFIAPFIGYFSSLVDRILVYYYITPVFIVLKIFDLEFFKIKKNQIAAEFLIITFSFITLFFWLNFANHKQYWSKYSNYLIKLIN